MASKSKGDRNKGNIGIFQILQKKYDLMKYDPAFKCVLGYIPQNVIMVVFGESGHGKTEFTMRLTKSFCQGKTKVDWISYEQGHGLDMQMALKRNNMIEVANYFSVTDPNYKKNPNTSYLEDLHSRVSKRGSADVFVIDSLQYMMITVADYYELKNKYPSKGFIFISHQNGREPDGTTAKKVAYDGGCTIRVKHYIAHPVKNRYGGNDPYIIWEERARLLEQKFFLERDKTANNAPKIAENSHEDRGVSAHD